MTIAGRVGRDRLQPPESAVHGPQVVQPEADVPAVVTVLSPTVPTPFPSVKALPQRCATASPEVSRLHAVAGTAGASGERAQCPGHKANPYEPATPRHGTIFPPCTTRRPESMVAPPVPEVTLQVLRNATQTVFPFLMTTAFLVVAAPVTT